MLLISYSINFLFSIITVLLLIIGELSVKKEK